ncbi:unnamed protein product [Phytophthora lilii]|uniref:Unnamed protein product n=1 Tax=Phytophthora lilii TaxID=2077276 RepID=A0A9W6TFP8_9STRA|nr:unnamed protein product [Phytophthora lilii]
MRTTLNWIEAAAKRMMIGPLTSHVWPHYLFIQLILPSTDSVGSGTPTEFANSSQAKRNSVNCFKVFPLSLLVVVFHVTGKFFIARLAFFGVSFYLQSTMANKAKNDTSTNSTRKSARGKESVSKSSSTLDKNCKEEQRATRTKSQGFSLFNF